MSHEFRVGMKVVCIADSFSNMYPDIGERAPQRGEIYTIRTIGIGDNGLTYLRFVEIVNPQIPYGRLRVLSECQFIIHKFRPLESKPIELFRAIARGISDGKPIVEDAEWRAPKPERVRA